MLPRLLAGLRRRSVLAYPSLLLLLGLTCFSGLVSCGVEAESMAAIDDTGDLHLSYEKAKGEDFKRIRAALEETAFFDDLVDQLNQKLAFPNDINIVFTTCGVANAFYSPSDLQVTMCYELIAYYLEIFEENIETEEDYQAEVIDATSFTFFHELGHAFVDQYELPITGNEEDAADNFATIILLDVYGDDLGVISGMFQFDAEAMEEMEDPENLAYWGEHSLSTQRYYNTACLIYGSDPESFSFIVEDEYLPEERAERCEAEYEQKSGAWWTLMEPFLKEEI